MLTAYHPDPLAVFKGPTSNGVGGIRGEEKVGKERERKSKYGEGKNWEGNGLGTTTSEGERRGREGDRKEERGGEEGKRFAGPMSNCFVRPCVPAKTKGMEPQCYCTVKIA